MLDSTATKNLEVHIRKDYDEPKDYSHQRAGPEVLVIGPPV